MDMDRQQQLASIVDEREEVEAALNASWLRQMLVQVFAGPKALRLWASNLAQRAPGLGNVLQQVNWANPIVQVAFELVEQLRALGALDDAATIEAIGRSLLEVAPLRKADIYTGFGPKAADRLGPTLSADAAVTDPPPQWKGKDEQDGLERLLAGDSTLLDVCFLRRGLEIAGGVVLIKAFFGMRSVTGTAFRIGPSHLLTNHHVVFDPKDPKRTADRVVLQLGYETRLDGSIDNGQTLVDDAPLVPAFERSCEPARDWALVQLSSPLPGFVTTIAIVGAPPPEVDDRAYIIQHPAGRPKQIGLNRNLIRYVDASVIQYLTDTQRGSSGSPVFNKRWELIGLHSRYIKSEHEQTYGYRNQGMRIEPIIQRLSELKIDLTGPPAGIPGLP